MTPKLVLILSIFVSVFLAVCAFGFATARTRQVRARLMSAHASSSSFGDLSSARAIMARNFDQTYFKLDRTARNKLRDDLIRAGFFSADAVAIFMGIRFLLLIGLPAFGWIYASYFVASASWAEESVLAGLFAALAFYLPKAWLSRRGAALQIEYRNSFPDMMDWLLVCADAGLSLEAAIDRVAAELSFLCPQLGVNLTIVTAEVRAGRSTIDALQSFADRVGIDEANSLVTLMRQSIELGSSVGQALKIYSEEMRDRRMSRAEERAHQLPIKLMAPLALFIFPNIMLILFLPIVSRFMVNGLIPTIPN